MDLLNKWLNKFDQFLMYISGGTIFLMMILIILDVLLRAFFNSPITGTMEITGEYFLVIITYFAISYTHKLGQHVTSELANGRFSKGIEKVMKIVSNLLSLFIFIILGINNFNVGLEFFAKDVRSVSLLGYPLGPALIIISIGILSLCLRIFLNTLALIRDKEKSLIRDKEESIEVS